MPRPITNHRVSEHIHPSQRGKNAMLRAARTWWSDDGRKPEPMIKVYIGNRPIQILTHDQAIRFANQIVDQIEKERNKNEKHKRSSGGRPRKGPSKGGKPGHAARD